jgi:polyisoprenoid-binding protein YceI
MAIWKIDPAHSEIKFKVKHMVISTVTGQFNDFDATIESDKEDFSDAKVRFEANVNSVNTKNEQRDTHLKSADFFDAANYQKINFVSKTVNKRKENHYEITGDLTIRGIKKPVKLNVKYNGTVSGFGNQDIAGFEISGKVNRFDYGLKWNTLTDAGGIVVGDEVKLEIFAELNKQQEASRVA